MYKRVGGDLCVTSESFLISLLSRITRANFFSTVRWHKKFYSTYLRYFFFVVIVFHGGYLSACEFCIA